MESVNFLDEKIKPICESYSIYYFPWGIGKNIDGSKFWTEISNNTYIIHMDFHGDATDYEKLKKEIAAFLKEQSLVLEKSELIDDTFYGCEEKLYFIERNSGDELLLPKTRQAAKAMWKSIVAAISFVAAIIAIIVFVTGKNLPDFGNSNTSFASIVDSQNVSAGTNLEQTTDYFISVAISDTFSTNFEPAKKIVATASADTENIIIISQSDTDTYGPFNMTMETERRFSFIAVFEEPGIHYVTITAYSSEGTVATKEISIDI